MGVYLAVEGKVMYTWWLLMKGMYVSNSQCASRIGSVGKDCSLLGSFRPGERLEQRQEVAS